MAALLQQRFKIERILRQALFDLVDIGQVGELRGELDFGT